MVRVAPPFWSNSSSSSETSSIIVPRHVFERFTGSGTAVSVVNGRDVRPVSAKRL